jgi:hypothetical protein
MSSYQYYDFYAIDQPLTASYVRARQWVPLIPLARDLARQIRC